MTITDMEVYRVLDTDERILDFKLDDVPCRIRVPGVAMLGESGIFTCVLTEFASLYENVKSNLYENVKSKVASA